jgi:hypothetical protein
MIIRRAAFFAQFPLAVVLPAWVFIARGIFADGLGLQSVAYLIACPMLFIGMMAIAALTSVRKLVRLERALSWTDVGVLSALWASLVLYGFFAEAGIAAAIVALLLVAFWFAIWELIHEARARLTSFRASLSATQEPGDAGPIIVVPLNKA